MGLLYLYINMKFSYGRCHIPDWHMSDSQLGGSGSDLGHSVAQEPLVSEGIYTLALRFIECRRGKAAGYLKSMSALHSALLFC